MSQNEQGEQIEPATDTGQSDTVTVKRKRGRPAGIKTPISKQAKANIRDKKILQLRSEGHGGRVIARSVGCSVGTVYNVLEKFKEVFTEVENVEDYQQVRGKLLSSAELKLLKSAMSQEKIDKASLNNVAYSLKQIHDMRRLEDGLSTKNIETHVRHTRQSLPDGDLTE